jgi:serine/threonine protein phosphatase PrpC
MQNAVQLESASVSDRGLSDKRPQNEDSFLELPEKGIFAVADGVGGAQAGDVASQMAVEILGEAFSNRINGDAEAVMKLAIERANSAIFQMASDLPQLASMATTLVAVHLAGDVATIGHVGDSRLYRIDRDGNVFRETNDHSVVEEEVRAGRMTPEQALHHPNRNIISRAIGADGTIDIDLKTIIAEPGTRFLLCSDGITRHIEDFEIRDIFGSIQKPEDVCYRLKEICYDRGAEDNLTAIVVRIGDEGADLSVRDELEDEEVTIASARSPFEETISNEEHPSDVTAGAEEAGSIAEGPSDEDSFLMIDSEESGTLEPTRDPKPDPVPVQEATAMSAAATDVFHRTTATASPQMYPAEVEKTGLAAKVLSTVALLALGVVIGAAVVYWWKQANPEPVAAPAAAPPPITEMKSSNPVLTSFEEARRQVDGDPERYLNAKAASPQSAEDYYLLGRAFLLSGKYWEAKRSFNEAKSRLSQTDGGNARMLSTEIAMAIAIIESPLATETFSKNISAARAAGTNSNTNASSVIR